MENRTVPCVTTHPRCHNPSLPSKANKRLGPLCSSLCWWPRTKCDSRGWSPLLHPSKAPKRRHRQPRCFGGRDAVPSGGGKWDSAQQSPGLGRGVTAASASGPRSSVTFASRRRCQLPAALSPAPARCAPAWGTGTLPGELAAGWAGGRVRAGLTRRKLPAAPACRTRQEAQPLFSLH